jgi:SecD/SecF fusion protein
VDDGTSRYALAHGPKSKKWALKRAMPSRDFGTNRPCVDFQLDPRGGMQFAEMTKANINRQMAIFLDNVATSHATIISQIGERGQITGNFTQERVLEIVRKLEAGSLPARLKETPLQEKVVGPTLGARNRSMALKAAVIGFVAVVVYMVIYYTYLGVLADIALILNVLFLLAIMAAMEATFTLPGVAGVALTIGMAVDANVLINERIREELARGVSLKKAVQLGYDKAFAPIFDSNLTTLITSVILGYLGSEEVKGFALTLGFGVVISMFTSLFVTHLILDTLVERNLLKKLPMLHLIKDAKIDWMGLRKAFWTFSLITTVGGVAFFTWASTTDKEAVYDIELLGGSSVQIELADGVQMNAEQVLAAVTGKGKNADASQSGAAWLRRAADALKNAKIEPAPDAAGEYLVTAEGLDPADVNAMLLTTFERSLARNGFSAEGRTARFRTQALTAELDPNAPQGQPKDSAVDLDTFKRGVAEASEYIRAAANRLETAKVQSVAETGEDIKTSRAFEIVTVEPIKDVLRAAVLGTMGDKLKVDRRISFDVVTNAELAPDGMFPIREDANFLGEVIGTEAPVDIRSYKGGVVFIFDNLQPPQTIAGLERRFREMRLQPQFEQTESRETKLVGLQEAGKTASGEPLYSKVARLVSDESILYTDNPAQWEDKLARVELDQAREALTAERSLSKVVQFAPQMAKGTQQQALISMILAMIAIVIYVWVRFGTMQYGLAAVVAIFHDVGFTLGIATLATWLGLGDFKVDLSMIAAILTVIGYSVNDTIVVFDRIRENRGKLNVVTPAIINNSINGTLSRTILTGGTTLMTMFLMYFMGGPGVKTFCFVMLLGTIIGTYSSIGIAAPLLQSRRLLHTIVYCIMGGIAILTTYALSPTRGMLLAVSVMTIALICLLVVIERKADPDSDRSVVTA